MKKYFFILGALIAVFTACSKEIAVSEEELSTKELNEQTINADGTKTITLTATLPEVKASLDAVNHKVQWESSDILGVYSKKGTKVEFTTTGSGASATFTAEIAADDEIETGAIFVYPSSMLTAAGTVTYPDALPSSPLFPMAAKKTGASLAFQFIGATLAVTIDNVPSTATYISLTADDIVGDFTIDSELALTASSTTDEATYTVASAGSNTVYFPVPAGTYASGNIAVRVGDASDVYFKKTNTSSWTLSAGQYKGMAALHIGAKAYLKSSWSNWDETQTAPMTVNGTLGYTYTMNALADGAAKYVKVYMNYPGESNDDSVWRRMGPGASDVTTNSTFVVDNTHSVGITTPVYGQYTFTYAINTGAFTLSHTRDYVDFYFYGAKNSWALDKAYQLTYDSGLYSWEGVVGGQFKFYYNEYNGCVLGGDGEWLGSGKDNISTAAANYYVLFAKPDEWKYWMANMGNPNTVSSATNISLVGEFNSWNASADGVEFTNDASNGNIWRLTHTPSESGNFKIVKDHSWDTNWGYTAIEANVAGATGSDNFYLEKDVEYHIILSVQTGKIAIY